MRAHDIKCRDLDNTIQRLVKEITTSTVVTSRMPPRNSKCTLRAHDVKRRDLMCHATRTQGSLPRVHDIKCRDLSTVAQSPRLALRAHDTKCRDLLHLQEKAQGSDGELTTSNVVTYLLSRKRAQGSVREHTTPSVVTS